jgi:hypothetical protein
MGYGHEIELQMIKTVTRPAWAGFKTAEEGRAKICKFLWQKLKNKSNIKNIKRTILELF